MGNTDIVVTPLPDANTEDATGRSTIFDDVFRTIAQKMPQLLIPLINEVFHTSYSEEDHFEQLRNEHYEKFGTVVTDSIIRIGSHIYHLECQSTRDETMVQSPFASGLSRSDCEVCRWAESALPRSDSAGENVHSGPDF